MGTWPFAIGITDVPGSPALPLCADGGLCWKFATAAAVAALTGVTLDRGGDVCADTTGEADPFWFMKFAARCCAVPLMFACMLLSWLGSCERLACPWVFACAWFC